MSIISCKGISVSYGTNEIINDISFSVNKGERLGIIGVNGAGKSTLFKCICGIIEPTSGTVSLSPGTSLGYLEQYADKSFDGKSAMQVALEQFPDLTKMEEELASLEASLSDGDESLIKRYTSLSEEFKAKGGYEYRAKVKSFLKKLGFTEESLETDADILSGGQKTRLSLAALLLASPDIILLDEPTNHLDINATEWLEDYIKNSSSTFLIISHDRFFLDRTTTDTLEIENTFCQKYSGGYTEFKEKKKQLLETQEKHYELQQKEIKRLEAFIAKQREWNRERNIIAAESRLKAIDRMVKIEKPKAAPKTVKFEIHSKMRGGTDVLSVRGVSKRFGKQVLFEKLSFELKKSERLFIIGGNGTGKSTLLKLITERLSADEGVIELGYGQTLGYYDQEQLLLDNSLTVIDELWNAYPTLNQTELRNALASYGFYGDDVFKPVSNLSGGEKARLSIAKLVLSGVSLLVLDEPTNYLDIASKETLEDALKAYEGTLLCVSHDRYFISSLASSLLDIEPTYSDGYYYFKGNYADYLKKRPQSVLSDATEKSKGKGSDDYLNAKKEKSNRRKEEKRKAFLESETARIEERIKAIEAEEESCATDYIKLQELSEEKESIENLLLEYYDELLAYMDD